MHSAMNSKASAEWDMCETNVKVPDMAILDHYVFQLQVSKSWLLPPKKEIYCKKFRFRLCNKLFFCYDAVLPEEEQTDR